MKDVAEVYRRQKEARDLLIHLLGQVKPPKFTNRYGHEEKPPQRPESVVHVELVKQGCNVQNSRLDKGRKYASPMRLKYAFTMPWNWRETVVDAGLVLIEGQMICLSASPVPLPDVCDGCWCVIAARPTHTWQFKLVCGYAVKMADVVMFGDEPRTAYNRCWAAHLVALGIDP